MKLLQPATRLPAIAGNPQPDSGFTLVEILIVVVITAIISSFAIVYSQQGERQISLYVEEQKIVAYIDRARSLTVGLYNQGDPSSQPLCGYGVQINYANGKETYSIFGYQHPSGPASPKICEGVNAIDTSLITTDKTAVSQSDVNVPVDPNVQLDGSPSDALQYVVFIAPAPRTIITTNGGGGPGSVHLKTPDGKSTVTITVSSAGQVDF